MLFSLYSSIYPSAYSSYCVPLYLGGNLDSIAVDFLSHQNVAQETFSPLQVGIDYWLSPMAVSDLLYLLGLLNS